MRAGRECDEYLPRHHEDHSGGILRLRLPLITRPSPSPRRRILPESVIPGSTGRISGFRLSSAANLLENIVLNQVLADTFPVVWVIGNFFCFNRELFSPNRDLF